jgi:hypothetical protein
MYSIDRRPQPIEEVARQLAERNDRNGRRKIETIPHVRDGCVSCSDRRRRSLQKRSLPAERKEAPAPRPSNGYVPELADALDRDLRLSDGARRCARVIAAHAYRKHREDRALPVTVSYLCKALGKRRRTVQGYLRQLEAAGYIDVRVALSARTRMCVGLIVNLCAALFPRHGWPEKAIKPGAQFSAQIYRTEIYKRQIPRAEWWFRCVEGMDRVRSALAGPPPDAFRL